MDLSLMFFLNSMLLGLGLSMDAFSISIANGLNEKKMKKNKAFLIAGTFAFFQGLMPMLGWICVHTIVEHFTSMQKFVPFVALILLLLIGGKMIFDGIKKKEEVETLKVGFIFLLVQGIATSIDALSVGFTIATYGIWNALLSAVIIALITFGVCLFGVFVGKKFGSKLSDKATIIGGIILIIIGLEIFITGII